MVRLQARRAPGARSGVHMGNKTKPIREQQAHACMHAHSDTCTKREHSNGTKYAGRGGSAHRHSPNKEHTRATVAGKW